MTKNPISNISYNSEEFLKEKLDLWVLEHKIQSYQYIKHKKEGMEKKDHIHLRIVPNKGLDPMDLSEELREYVPENKKPLGVRDWRPAKEEDWTLYILHDKYYLKSKYGEEYQKSDGKIPYTVDDIVCPDFYDVEVQVIRAQQWFKNSQASIMKSLREGKRMMNLVEEGKDVYVVNACMRTLKLTEFEKTVQERNQYRDENAKLVWALKNAHIYENLKEDKEKGIYYFDRAFI